MAKRILKWAGLGVGGLLILLLLMGGALYWKGGQDLAKSYTVEASTLTIPTDSAALARGEHLTRTHGCRNCHGANLEGKVFFDAPPALLAAPNLTAGRGGIGATYTDADWERSIRHGVRPNGQGMFVMPSEVFVNFSDADTGALIAYLKQAPPVDNELPARELRFLGRILLATGEFFMIPDILARFKTTEAAPPPGATAEYGRYLASTGCIGCHGPDLHGMQPPDPDSPLAPDLAAAGQWSLADLMQTLRTGTTPAGKVLDPRFMPWEDTKSMTDMELEALHLYLQSLPPRATPAS
jgi:mono/diheme cytochrome c family protein